MKITAIDHMQIAVPPELEQAALAFYHDVLGLQRVQKPTGTGDTRGAWFDAGNIQLHVGIQQEGFKPATKAHPGFVVENLVEARATLEAAGVTVQPGGEIPGFKRVFAQDPAGNRLEFMQPMTRPARAGESSE